MFHWVIFKEEKACRLFNDHSYEVVLTGAHRQAPGAPVIYSQSREAVHSIF